MIPKTFQPEIQYTLEVLLDEFLGLKIAYSQNTDSSDIEIHSPGMNTIIIQNHFFSNFNEPSGYLNISNLPEVQYWTDAGLSLNALPVLYGYGKLEFIDSSFICHADVIASAFFMLSRWEEVVDQDKDQHARSTGAGSTAYKYHFLQRPIVNEYADLIWAILLRAGYQGDRKKHKYTNVVTHDVDQQFKWPDGFTSIKHLTGDLIKRKDLALFKNNFRSYLDTKFNQKRDPFDTHDELLKLADHHGIKSYFNFTISRETRDDVALKISDPRLKNLIDRIESAGHTIGFHPGYNTHLDTTKFNNELSKLQSLTQQQITCGRQHFLRFKVSDTWRLWHQAGMAWESSMSYSDMPGFRCGTCYPYTVFDVEKRIKLSVKEKPLIVMDATLIYYVKSWDWQDLFTLKNECKKHGGEFVSIWHNDLVNHPDLKEYEKLIYL